MTNYDVFEKKKKAKKFAKKVGGKLTKTTETLHHCGCRLGTCDCGQTTYEVWVVTF